MGASYSSVTVLMVMKGFLEEARYTAFRVRHKSLKQVGGWGRGGKSRTA